MREPAKLREPWENSGCDRLPMPGRIRAAARAFSGCLIVLVAFAASAQSVPGARPDANRSTATLPGDGQAADPDIDAGPALDLIAQAQSGGSGQDAGRRAGQVTPPDRTGGAAGFIARLRHWWAMLSRSVEDGSFARWIFAAAGLVATGLAIWAIVLLKRTLDATRRAIGAVQEINEITRDSAERQLRAYVSLTPGVTTYQAGPHSNFGMTVHQKNNGQTPATEVRFGGYFRTLPFPLPDDIEFDPPDLGSETKVIAPGQDFEAGRQAGGIDDQFVDGLQAAGNRLYFYGVLEYCDVYGRTRETTACWSYGIDDMKQLMEIFRKNPRQRPLQMRCNFADRHNDAT